jgi:hypothetical protein
MAYKNHEKKIQVSIMPSSYFTMWPIIMKPLWDLVQIKSAILLELVQINPNR